MEFRQLGGSGFKVPVLCLGTGTFGAKNESFRAFGASDVQEATRLVDVSLETGDEIGPEGPGSPNMGLGSMILMVTVGSFRSSAAHGKSGAVKISPESSEILLKWVSSLVMLQRPG